MRATFVGLATAVGLALAPDAHAQQNVQQIGQQGFKNISITGQQKGGGTFQTFFDVTRFEARGGRVWAVGTLHGGSLGSSSVPAALPVSNGNDDRGRGNGDDDQGGFGGHGSLLKKDRGTAPATFPGSNGQPFLIDAQAACPILNLTLGPLDLNLLGLVVHLDRVVLDINAQPGAGNLLGNLLCAVANLLNGLNLNGALAGAIANLLNAVAAALGGLPI